MGQHDAAGHARVAGIDQAPRRRRECRRLDAGAEARDRIILVDERHRQLVAHAKVQCEIRRDVEFVLRVAGKQPAVTILDGLRRRGAHLRRRAEQEIGGRIARQAAAEGEVAVGSIDERDRHRLTSHIEARLERMAAGDPRQVVGRLPGGSPLPRNAP